ncbi:MAG: regulatory iron-sulfur-containing complex subunit RicT [Oscillospiraceae bacterium]
MTEVISVKFKDRGKSYFFAPGTIAVPEGADVIVETSKGLEIGRCCRANHEVADTAVVQPLRPVIRVATDNDLRVAEINKSRERDAFGICQRKIAEHGLDMKLVDAECSFEGNKTTFFFTSDGRVDFRELVKDLAGVFRNRIELRQIGVRDEAKMLGGIGICGRPFCCSEFLEDFQPVSTKMAKMQSMSLNPTKISGSCGRLMCCLRYEEAAYEDLVKTVPKLGTFVETPAGYGQVSQVSLLRRTVKVRIDGSGEEVIKPYPVDDIAVVPGGRPKPGEQPAEILKYRPVVKAEAEETPENDFWKAPTMLATDPLAPQQQPPQRQPSAEVPVKKKSQRRGRRSGSGPSGGAPNGEQSRQGADVVRPKPVQPTSKPAPRAPSPEGQAAGGEKNGNFHRRRGNRPPKPEGQ